MWDSDGGSVNRESLAVRNRKAGAGARRERPRVRLPGRVTAVSYADTGHRAGGGVHLDTAATVGRQPRARKTVEDPKAAEGSTDIAGVRWRDAAQRSWPGNRR